MFSWYVINAGHQHMNMIFFVPNVSETPLKSEGLKLRKKKMPTVVLQQSTMDARNLLLMPSVPASELLHHFSIEHCRFDSVLAGWSPALHVEPPLSGRSQNKCSFQKPTLAV